MKITRDIYIRDENFLDAIITEKVKHVKSGQIWRTINKTDWVKQILCTANTIKNGESNVRFWNKVGIRFI